MGTLLGNSAGLFSLGGQLTECSTDCCGGVQPPTCPGGFCSGCANTVTSFLTNLSGLSIGSGCYGPLSPGNIDRWKARTTTPPSGSFCTNAQTNPCFFLGGPNNGPIIDYYQDASATCSGLLLNSDNQFLLTLRRIAGAWQCEITGDLFVSNYGIFKGSTVTADCNAPFTISNTVNLGTVYTSIVPPGKPWVAVGSGGSLTFTPCCSGQADDGGI